MINELYLQKSLIFTTNKETQPTIPGRLTYNFDLPVHLLHFNNNSDYKMGIRKMQISSQSLCNTQSYTITLPATSKHFQIFSNPLRFNKEKDFINALNDSFNDFNLNINIALKRNKYCRIEIGEENIILDYSLSRKLGFSQTLFEANSKVESTIAVDIFSQDNVFFLSLNSLSSSTILNNNNTQIMDFVPLEFGKKQLVFEPQNINFLSIELKTLPMINLSILDQRGNLMHYDKQLEAPEIILHLIIQEFY